MDLQEKDCQTGRGPPHHQFHNDYQSDPHASPLTRTLRSQQLIANKPMLRIAVYLMSGVILTMEVEHTATTQDIIAIIQSEKELGLGRISSPLGQPVFALWLCSQQLEVQLGPTHKPLELGARWPRLLAKYGSDEIRDEEQPVLYYRRNIFLARSDEEQVKEAKTLELLYAEARHNVLEGRYPCEGQARYASLGALQARIELGPYNAQIHTLAYFRRHKGRFLPHHFTSPTLLLGLGLGLGLVGGKGAPEVRLLDQYKRIPPHTGTNAHPRKLIRKYLEFCWGLPCYGATFFHGQIERPVRGLASWITHRDLKVLVAINALGVYIVDDAQCSLLLGLKYSELSWEMAKPSDERNPDCLPCLFLQFPVRENGAHVFKILQVFSRQKKAENATLAAIWQVLADPLTLLSLRMPIVLPTNSANSPWQHSMTKGVASAKWVPGLFNEAVLDAGDALSMKCSNSSPRHVKIRSDEKLQFQRELLPRVLHQAGMRCVLYLHWTPATFDVNLFIASQRRAIVWQA